jgi:TIR domain
MIRDSIFISYSHKDAKWLNEVKKHLSILEHNHELIIWDDSKIKTGSDWKNEIDQSIKRCRVAILLVSTNFLSSEFILKKELPHILKAAKNDGLTIFNVILETCAFHLTELEAFQCLNPKFPLEELKPSDRKRVLVGLTTELLAVVGKDQLKSSDVHGLDENTDVTRILTLACLVKRGPLSITEIQHCLLLRRKLVVSSLEALQKQAYIEKIKVEINKKPATQWKALELGISSINLFESAYSNLTNSIK